MPAALSNESVGTLDQLTLSADRPLKAA